MFIACTRLSALRLRSLPRYFFRFFLMWFASRAVLPQAFVAPGLRLLLNLSLSCPQASSLLHLDHHS